MGLQDLTNFPNGITSFGFPVLPFSGPVDSVLWVDSANGKAGNSGNAPDKALATVGGTGGAWAKAATTANGTLVAVMQGHTESISGADYASDLGTNKRIYTVGMGSGPSRPTLTWATAGTTFLLDTQEMVLDNMILQLEPTTGTVNVAAPITISGAGSGLRRCLCFGGTDANNKVTIGITITAADCFLDSVRYYAATAATATTHLRLTGANRLQVRDLVMYAATTAVGVGTVQFLTTASTNMNWDGFKIANNLASSTDAVTGMAANTGFASRGHLHVTNNNATDLTTAWSTKASVQFRDVVVTNDVGEVGTSLLPLSA
jgi:hypothetical protein